MNTKPRFTGGMQAVNIGFYNEMKPLTMFMAQNIIIIKGGRYPRRVTQLLSETLKQYNDFEKFIQFIQFLRSIQ